MFFAELIITGKYSSVQEDIATLRKQESRRIFVHQSRDGKAINGHQEGLCYRMPESKSLHSGVARSESHFLHTAGDGRL